MTESAPRLALAPNLSTSVVLAALRRRRAERLGTAAPLEEAALGYRNAAAVLHIFNPATLRSPDPAADANGSASFVTQISVPAVGYRDQMYRSLRSDVRASALRELGDREAMRRALAANPQREMTIVQHLFEVWLDDRLTLENLSYVELEAIRQLYDWELEAFGGLPPRARLDVVRAQRASVAQFEHLVDRNFVGRDAELQVLRDYVGVVSPTVWAQVRDFLSRGPRPPLVLHGRGGVGKTALIGRFLLEHVQSPKVGWFPFVYLAFDSDSIDVREPWTLLNAASEQLAAQATPSSDDEVPRKEVEFAFAAFRSAVGQYREQRFKTRRRSAGFRSQAERHTRT